MPVDKNLKVSTRLTLAFALLLVLMTMIAGVGLFHSAQLNDGLNEIVEAKLPKIIAASDWSVNLLKSAYRLRNLVEEGRSAEVVHGDLAAISELRGERNKIIEELDRTLVKPKGIAAMKAIAVPREKAETLEAAFVRLAVAGDAAGARALLKELQPVQLAYLKEVNSLIEINRAVIASSVGEAHKTYAVARSTALVLLLVSLAAGTLAAVWMSRSLLRQLGGEPAAAAALAQAVSDGDLGHRVLLRPGDTASLMAQMAAMQAKLSAVVASVRRGADSVSTASAEIASGNNDLSSRTELQASALEATASSMQQLGSTVRQNADNAAQANQLALSASSVAVRGGDVVGQVVDTMRDINASSKRIADIIGTIDGIAFQTNILALNAAVEAARAGDQGRGFAVVASEVRSLAQRSADAAKEIKTLISASVERVEQGTALVDKAGATMAEVVGSIKRVTDIMGEITAASKEQTTGVAQVGEAVAQMDRSTQQNAALVEQSAAAAESLRSQAAQLVHTVAIFRLA